MLTKLKKAELNFWIWWKNKYIYWVYLQSWYLIKSRKMRHLKRDWALTQKFFRRTTVSFYWAKYLSHQLFIFINFLKNNNYIYTAPIFSWYYRITKLYYWYDQFIEISFALSEQYSKWISIETWKLIEFPYIFDKVDRKKRWSKLWRHWAKKYITTLKYYNGKITSFKGSE